MSSLVRVLVLIAIILTLPGALKAADVPEPLINADQTRCDSYASAADKLKCGTHYGHYYSTEWSTPVTNSSEAFIDYVGKLYFTKDSATHYCTAQFVEPFVLLTAAHCTQGSSDFCFIPRGGTFESYANCGTEASAVKGIRAACVAENKNWNVVKGKSDLPDKPYIGARYDYAFLQMRTAGPISGPFKVKTRPIWGAEKELWLVGFPPSATVLQNLYQAEGGLKGLPHSSHNFRFGDVLHPNLMAAGARLMDPKSMDFRFGPGVSGGAWFLKKGGEFYIISVNSTFTRNADATYEVMYGPMFDQKPNGTTCYRDAALGSCDVSSCD